MNPQTPDREVAARLAARLAELSNQLQYARAELGDLQRMMDARETPARWPAHPAHAEERAPAHPGVIPYGQSPVPPRGVPPRPAAVPTTRWWEREGVVSRVLAVAGAALTLVGIVLLLILAAQAGYFGPLARVTAGTVFSVALLAAAWRVESRPGGKVGAVALAATGIAGLYLSVLAVTAIYEWLPVAAGLLVALLIAGSGLTLALRWESQLLALIVVIGSVALAPFMTDGITPILIAFYLVLFAASFPIQYQRNWPALLAARTVPIALAILTALAFIDPVDSEAGLVVVAAAVFALLGGAGSLLVAHRNPAGFTASAMTATAVVPLLFSGAATTRETYIALMLMLAIAAGAVFFVARGLSTAARTVVAAIALLAVMCGALAASSAALRPVVVLALAAATLLIARQKGVAVARYAGYAYGVAGAVLYLNVAPPELLFDSETAAESASAAPIAASFLLLAVALLAAETAPAAGPDSARDPSADGVWILSGLIGLYAVSSGAVLAGVAVGGPDAGFRGGHAAATVLWMLASIALLLYGLHRRAQTGVVGAGLALAALAVTKLLLFDLAALDGFYRVLTFLAVGVLLLAAGTRYAREYAERAGSESTKAEADPKTHNPEASEPRSQ